MQPYKKLATGTVAGLLTLIVLSAIAEQIAAQGTGTGGSPVAVFLKRPGLLVDKANPQ